MKLKELRLSKNISQANIAKVLEVSFLTYSRWERHIGSPTPDNFEKLCKYLEATPDDIVAKDLGSPIGANIR